MRTVWILILLVIAGAACAEGKTWRWQSPDGVVHYSDKPPPPDARNVQEFSASGNVIDNDPTSYAVRKAAADHPVTLFTAPNCADDCKIAREYLASRAVPFSELLMNKDEDLAGYRKIFGPEEAMVPSITVGNTQKSKGFERGQWKRMLDLAGYPAVGGRVLAPATTRP
ncbi:MAG: DUF4124 domain-containing protein [Sterolibacteriaceae bacterium]|nr:DUF4124 domain-containing protein [Sterolibacteriaceae bacterium]MBK9086372.1 DUF4124 domain-containing protein [Sterolibacteriaceae bacterium]